MRITRRILLVLANGLAIVLLVELGAYLFLPTTSPQEDWKERIRQTPDAPG